MKRFILLSLTIVTATAQANLTGPPGNGQHILPPNYILPAFQGQQQQMNSPQFGLGGPQPNYLPPQPMYNQMQMPNQMQMMPGQMQQPMMLGQMPMQMQMPYNQMQMPNQMPYNPTFGQQNMFGQQNSMMFGQNPMMQQQQQQQGSGFGSLLSGLAPMFSKLFSGIFKGSGFGSDSNSISDSGCRTCNEARHNRPQQISPEPDAPIYRPIAQNDRSTEGGISISSDFAPMSSASAEPLSGQVERGGDRVASANSDNTVDNSPAPPPPSSDVVDPAPAETPAPRAKKPKTQKASPPPKKQRGLDLNRPVTLSPDQVKAKMAKLGKPPHSVNSTFWNLFTNDFQSCAPGCQPYNYSSYRNDNHSCHGQGKAMDVFGMVCNGKKILAINNDPRFKQLVTCMRGRGLKVLYQQNNGRGVTKDHWNHAHFSNGCTLSNGRKYW